MTKLFWLVCLIILTGCGTIALSPVKMAQSSLERLVPSNDAQADVPVFTASEQDFAFDLYRKLSSQPGNILFSPHSLYMNLIMDSSGARGETERQMSGVLHSALPNERLHAAANVLDQDLSSAGSKEKSFQLSVANSLWVQQDYIFKADYLDLLAQNYGTGIRLVDYTQEKSRQQAVLAINQWASDQTRGKIKDLVNLKALNDFTRLVLVSTIYFNAEWLERFEPDGDHEFYLRDGSQARVPFITSQRRDNQGKSISTSGQYNFVKIRGDGLTVVQVPYKGDRVSFVALMPGDNTTLAELEANLTSEYLQNLLPGYRHNLGINIFVEMPKFNFEVPLELSASLAEMGMPEAFDEFKADFSGMDGTRNLFIFTVVQKTFINLNELGTEAASATYTGFKTIAMPISKRLDRPFIFLILDRPTGAILFMGRMEDPR